MIFDGMLKCDGACDSVTHGAMYSKAIKMFGNDV